jgi:hypothetical protein
MAQTIGDNSTKTNTGNTRRAELLWQVLDSAHVQVWYQLNQQLLKWVKWEKGLYKKAAIKWLQQKYKAQPRLFPHWQLVHP